MKHVCHHISMFSNQILAQKKTLENVSLIHKHTERFALLRPPAIWSVVIMKIWNVIIVSHLSPPWYPGSTWPICVCVWWRCVSVSTGAGQRVRVWQRPHCLHPMCMTAEPCSLETKNVPGDICTLTALFSNSIIPFDVILDSYNDWW